jgi:hypothetical protein
MHHRQPCLIVIAAALIASGCGGAATAPDSMHSLPLRSYPEKAVVHWQSVLSWDERSIEEAAESNILILPIQWCFSEASRGVLGEIRQLNPDVQIVAYQSVMGVYTQYPDTSYLRATIPYELDYYDAVHGDWAWTTAGDTLMTWDDLIALNPVKNGALNRDLIDCIVDLIADYQVRSDAAIDGIMHDYFSYCPYINPSVSGSVFGEIDFDGDGIVFDEDADEQSLFYLWQVEYAKAIRTRFGDDFIQIGNGRPPQEDAGLARCLNGIFYELYPNNPWGDTDSAGLLRLLENQREGYLRKAKGRTWSLCTNEKGNANNNNIFCLLSSLAAGCMYTEMQGSYVFDGWTLDVESGAPAGPATVEGSMDSTLTVKRRFENGVVRISFYDTGRRQEYVFEPAAASAR